VSDPVGDQYSADAWEGDSGQADANQAYTFDSPELPAGATLNQGVPGTTVRPGDDPVVGAQLNADVFQTEMDPAQTNATYSANAALPANLLGALAGGANGGDAGPGMGGVGDAGGGAAGAGPNQMKLPPPPTISAGGGYITAQVVNADSSLLSAVASAMSGAGRQAALMAGTATMTGSGVSIGGGAAVGSRSTPASALVLGANYGGATQFGDPGDPFGAAVNEWYQNMINALMSQRQGGAGGGGGGGGGGGANPNPNPDSVGEAVDRAVGKWSGEGPSSGPDFQAGYGLPTQAENAASDKDFSPGYGLPTEGENAAADRADAATSDTAAQPGEPDLWDQSNQDPVTDPSEWY
jgi:hypothetical protein